VPYGDDTAENGTWEKGPGYDFFKALKDVIGKKKVIAEDLGFLTESVVKLVKKSGYPGMKILQFAFDTDAGNVYLPHNYDRNCVVYTGTHDNDTTVSWARHLPQKDIRFAMEYLGVDSRKDIAKACVKAAIASSADTAIIPLQDYLGLGGDARINTPSTLGGNWRWRMNKGALSKELAKKIKKMVKTYGRL
jgi:4-alpha-glucanotransferase